MSGLIKRAAARDAVAPLPRLGRVASNFSTPPVEDPRITTLQAEVARLECELSDQRLAAEQAIAVARRKGQEEAVANDEARTVVVANALETALEVWRTRLADLDNLALALTRNALAKIFDNPDDRTELVAGTVTYHLNRVGEQAAVGVRVSAEDFAAETLAVHFETMRHTITIDTALCGGEARIDLRLGHIDVSPADQWDLLDKALAAMELRR